MNLDYGVRVGLLVDFDQVQLVVKVGNVLLSPQVLGKVNLPMDVECDEDDEDEMDDEDDLMGVEEELEVSICLGSLVIHWHKVKSFQIENSDYFHPLGDGDENWDEIEVVVALWLLINTFSVSLYFDI